jgi:nucleotide-binding universal stress UspA family protein
VEKLFHKILVPVDFSPETLFIVHKAVELAREYSCQIHLLHVSSDQWSPAMKSSVNDLLNELDDSSEDDIHFNMTALADYIKNISNQEIEATFSQKKGKWNQEIIKTVDQVKCDLVLIARQEENRSGKKLEVDIDKIATRTDIPVISIPFGRRLTHIYSVLIPVTDFLPLRKLIYGAYIASSNQASIRLLGVEAPHTRGRIRHFLKTSYELIHENSPVYVSIALTETGNVAAAVDALAREEATDLILVNPKEQTEMPWQTFRHHDKTLAAVSSSPVLIVNPI